MKIRQLIILSLWPLIVTPSFAFDTKAYCKKVAEAAGGSYQIYESCLNEENSAKKRSENHSRNSNFVEYYETDEAHYFVDESAFVTIGSSKIFQLMTAYKKPQTEKIYDEKSSKLIKRKFWKKFEIRAVICGVFGDSRDFKKISSGAVNITSIYWGKSGQLVYKSPSSRTEKLLEIIRNYKPVLNSIQHEPFDGLPLGASGEIDYRLACER